jgi:hypothetical protein
VNLSQDPAVNGDDEKQRPAAENKMPQVATVRKL